MTSSGVRGPDHDRPALLVRGPQSLHLDGVQHEGIVELQFPVERDLGNPPSGRAEPALPHSSTVSPGSMRSTCDRVSFASASGVPVRSGKVPQWQGTQRGLPSSSSASAASSGPIV